MKLFYYLDFGHLKKYGSPVTFDTYVHLEHGPIPSFIKNLIDTAADDPDNSILADTVTFEKPEGIEMYRVLPKRNFTVGDKNLFSEGEMEILEQVCSRFGDKNTKYIEDSSHAEAPWKNTTFLDTIPYELASQDPDCSVTEEEIKLLLEIV